MIYRQLGATGRQVGIIGLGCEHLDRKPYEQVDETIGMALEHGVNILDVFMPGTEVREFIAKALNGRRKDVMIQGHIGSTDIKQQYDISRDLPTVKKYFEELLRLFGTIEFGMMFFIDSEDDYKNIFETGFATYVEKLKKQGDILHIGFSSHSPETAARAIRTGLPEMMMFSVNPAFDMVPSGEHVFEYFEKGDGSEQLRGLDPRRAELYALCEQKQIGITAMKAFGGGKLISAEHSPFGKPLTLAQCIHYALSRPAVASVLPGCKTAAEMLETLRYLDAPDSEKAYAEIINTGRNDFRGQCVYCGHCQPCPAGIDIAAVNKYLDIALLDKAHIPPSILSHYKTLPAGGAGCTGCGNCEARCPFGVPVIDKMNEAAELFNG